MSTVFRTSRIYFVLFILLGYSLLIYQIVFQTGSILNEEVTAEKGILDLSQNESGSNKIVNLTGECEFYWQKLLTPDDFKQNKAPEKDGYFMLPGVWNGYNLNGVKLDGDGYATFRLRIKVPRDGRYGIKIKEFDCAWKMFANGEETSVGRVGTSKKTMEPSWQRGELFFTSQNKQVELVLQISNFHHRKGGPEDVILFGPARKVLDYKKSQQAISYFLIGVLLIMGFHFLGLYLFRSVEKSALNFSLINFVILLRLATTNEKIFADLFTSIPWEAQIRIEYLAYMWPLPLFYSFFRSLYPDMFPKRFYLIALWSTIITSAIVIFLPVKLFSYTPWFFQMLILPYTFFYLVRMIQASINRYSDALAILNGYLFMFFVALNDFLYYNHLINTDFFLPLGLFVMVFTQSFVLTGRYAQALYDRESITKQLENSNYELEDTVKTRTSEILSQKDEIETQAASLQLANERLEELNAYKEKMTQMIVHDIKNPLNTIIGLTSVNDVPDKDLIIAQSGKDILTLAENMLDVARFQQAGIEFERQDVLLADVLDRAIGQCTSGAKQRDILFETDIDQRISISVNVKLIERVLVNLLTNAIKFSSANGKIKLKSTYRSAEQIILSVLDQGPGIAPELHDKIFETYFTHSYRNTNIHSAGLGLAFCKLVVEAHGGIIWVSDKQISGAEICLTLPLCSNDNVANVSVIKAAADVLLPTDQGLIDKAWLKAFSKHKIYEVGKINSLIQKMIQSGIPSTHSWIRQMNDAVIKCDEQKYNRLITEQDAV